MNLADRMPIWDVCDDALRDEIVSMNAKRLCGQFLAGHVLPSQECGESAGRLSDVIAAALTGALADAHCTPAVSSEVRRRFSARLQARMAEVPA